MKKSVGQSGLRKLVGDKAFYKMMLGIAVPIMIQNGITNFVGLLDNIMVGQVGTEQMSGIAIVNQLMLVFQLAIFGAISGAGIFGAQFYGSGDTKGVRHTFRFKMMICLMIVVVGILIFALWGEQLILLYLHGEGQETALADTLYYGRQYLLVMLFGLAPFAVEQAYSGTLRECGETKVPMAASILAVIVNLGLNYVLIFGKYGFPVLGVAGAAIATVISRYVQAVVVMVWTHTHAERMPFITDAYKELRIPAQLAVNILVKGTPLMCNEILWAAGIAALMQCYSVRGLQTVAALNISTTISNLFNVVLIAMGAAISVIVGQILGAGKMEEAKLTAVRMIAFSVAVCVVLGGGVALAAPLFPRIYRTSEEVRQQAASFLRIASLCMPLAAFMNSCYFTLRSGGKTFVTFLFDSAFLWCVSVPAAYVLSRYTAVPVVPLYLSVQLLDLIKCFIGFRMVRSGVWMHNIVGGQRKSVEKRA